MIMLGSLLLAVLILAAVLYTPDKARAKLEAKYHVGPADYRDVVGVRLRLLDSGPRDAPVVILLHGFGASLETWDYWASRLLTAGFRVIRFDLPGFGLTGPDPTGDYSDQRSLQVLEAVMDQLGVTRASLIGNSLGGKLAWSFAARYPQRVDRLVLISPDGFASPGFAYGKTPELPWMVRLLPYTLPRMLVRMSLKPAYGDPSRLSKATVTRYRDMMLAPGVRAAMIARMGQVMLVDPLPELRTIEAPTLILWGEKDGMIPVSNAADYLRAMPNAEVMEFPRLGHVPFEEAPGVTLPVTRQFLKGEAPRK
jgi:pimeloyl-ACP methyl ester carboxylesterase